MAFWVMTLLSDVIGYHCFRGQCCIHLQGWYPHHYTVSQPRRMWLWIIIIIM